VAGSLVLCACAVQRPAVQAKTDFSKIRRISVIPFEGAGGREVTDEFVRELVRTGLEVTDARHPGDAILGGTVTEYKPNNTLMVFLGKTTVMAPGGQPVVLNNPIVSPGGSQAVPESTATGARNAQVASVSAVVGVTARLSDASSGKVLWSGIYSYEGVDLQGALQPVVALMMQSMSRLLPKMNGRSS